jgi:tetratricopeptide (TPR) repeat protein
MRQNQHMARFWIVAALAAGLLAQEKKDTPKKPEPQPAEEQLPPEEDGSVAKPQEFSFNPVKSKRDVAVGDFYLKKGDFKAAISRYKEATQWNEGNAEAWLRVGEAEEKRGAPKAAKAAYEKYLALAPDAKNVPEVKKRLERLK